jgi:hypothetical protein
VFWVKAECNQSKILSDDRVSLANRVNFVKYPRRVRARAGIGAACVDEAKNVNAALEKLSQAEGRSLQIQYVSVACGFEYWQAVTTWDRRIIVVLLSPPEIQLRESRDGRYTILRVEWADAVVYRPSQKAKPKEYSGAGPYPVSGLGWRHLRFTFW